MICSNSMSHKRRESEAVAVKTRRPNPYPDIGKGFRKDLVDWRVEPPQHWRG